MKYKRKTNFNKSLLIHIVNCRQITTKLQQKGRIPIAVFFNFSHFLRIHRSIILSIEENKKGQKVLLATAMTKSDD